MENLKNIESLRPFQRFCCTIGEIPSSYKISLTYEEQLLWLCDYLENTVIPAINNNAVALKEVQDLFVKLKNYVDHYFDNLDVQSEINNKLDKMAEDGTLENILNNFILKNDTILIGDSYGVGYTVLNRIATNVNGWCYYFQKMLGLSNKNCYTFVEGGLGFADPGQAGHQNFLHLLQDNINSITNKKNIKNIIVCGGYNDTPHTFSEINSAIGSFISYCKQQFPYAKVFIGMVGNDGNTNQNGIEKRIAFKNKVLIAYQNCSFFGGIYLNGVENILKYYPNLCEDNYHPTEKGYEILGQHIFQAFSNGYVEYVLPKSSLILKNENVNLNQVKITSNIISNITQFSVTSGHLTFSSPISSNNGYIDLGEVDCANYKFTEYGTLVIPLFIGITLQNGENYGDFGYMSINNNNHLILGFRHYKNDGSQISNLSNITDIFLDTGSVCIPSLNC